PGVVYPRLSVLSALNISARSCRILLSVNRNTYATAKSTLSRPGRVSVLRPTVLAFGRPVHCMKWTLVGLTHGVPVRSVLRYPVVQVGSSIARVLRGAEALPMSGRSL